MSTVSSVSEVIPERNRSLSESKVKVISEVPEGVNPIAPSAVIAPIPVKSPVVDISQSDESIVNVSPSSPNVTAPPGVKVNAPVVVNVVDAPSKAISVSAILTSPSESNAPSR